MKKIIIRKNYTLDDYIREYSATKEWDGLGRTELSKDKEFGGSSFYASLRAFSKKRVDVLDKVLPPSENIKGINRSNYKIEDYKTEYFENNQWHGMNRRELQNDKKFGGNNFYESLRRFSKHHVGALDEVLPASMRVDRSNYCIEDYKQEYSENKEWHSLSRGGLQSDKKLGGSSFYNSLSRFNKKRPGSLDEVLPGKTQRDWTEQDPVEYFRQRYSHIKSRSQLAKEDRELYKKLREERRLDEVLPSENTIKRQALEKSIDKRSVRRERHFWDNNDPVKYFYKHYPNIKSRRQLQEEDKGVYCILYKMGKLDEILPEKQEKRDWTRKDPTKYFEENYPQIKTRKQLRNADRGLYHILKKTGGLDKVLPSVDTLKRQALEKVLVRYLS